LKVAYVCLLIFCFVVELVSNLHNFFGRIIRREAGGDTSQIGQVAATGRRIYKLELVATDALGVLGGAVPFQMVAASVYSPCVKRYNFKCEPCSMNLRDSGKSRCRCLGLAASCSSPRL
jgi:hypothetical protein